MQDHTRPIINAHHSSGPQGAFEGSCPPNAMQHAGTGLRIVSRKNAGRFRTGVFFGDAAALLSAQHQPVRAAQQYGIH